MRKSLLVYAAILVVFGLGIVLTIERGRKLPPRPGITNEAPPVSPGDSIGSAFRTNLREPLSRLFIQLLAILVVTRAVGAVFVRLGQPAVVGEMFAGILLGPSLFGLLSPEGYAFVFPEGSLGALKLLSQIGVCLFLFSVGMELNVGHLRGNAHAAVVVSHASILIPYFLGVAASLTLFPPLAGPGVSFVPFALFMGVSMSITAFPVLARILKERGLEKTPLGTMALTCAAVDDVTAWSLLAVVVAIVKSAGAGPTALSLGLVVVFVAIMLGVVRPRLPSWLGATTGGAPTQGQIAGVLALTFLSALTTEVIGIHALFGAFLAGVAMPSRSEFREFLKVRIESFSSIFLLPLFFAFTGLRTQIGLLDDAQGWLLCGGIVLIATAGKLGGSCLTARFTGMSWNDSFALGALMNTRGLMELIAINIGYDLGILSPKIFAMLVLMALATTFMTGPLLSLGSYLRRRLQAAPAGVTKGPG